MPKELNILSFESSCDDTSVAVLQAKEGEDVPRLLSLSVQSQEEVHERYGGVVPELASRTHLKNLLPCLSKAMSDARLSLSDIDYFAATARPGLVGCLLIGHTAAKTLSMFYEKPLLSCHHIEGHLMSSFLDSPPVFPFLAAVVSGGHTSLYRMNSYDDFEVMGVALDDALGEAFDKGAKLLGLPFPGGPALDKLAQGGNPSAYALGQVKVDGIAFSFSGLKSEFKRLIDREKDRLNRADAAASYQRALLDHLLSKVELALKLSGLKRLVVVGGVARNSQLRLRLSLWQQKGILDQWSAPRHELCTDNAAMIGVLAYRKILKKDFSSLFADVGATSRPKR